MGQDGSVRTGVDHDASEVQMKEQVAEINDGYARTGPDTLTLRLPVRKPDLAVPVVELMLKQ